MVRQFPIDLLCTDVLEIVARQRSSELLLYTVEFTNLQFFVKIRVARGHPSTGAILNTSRRALQLEGSAIITNLKVKPAART